MIKPESLSLRAIRGEMQRFTRTKPETNDFISTNICINKNLCSDWKSWRSLFATLHQNFAVVQLIILFFIYLGTYKNIL